MVNFPTFWKLCLDMLASGSGQIYPTYSDFLRETGGKFWYKAMEVEGLEIK